MEDYGVRLLYSLICLSQLQRQPAVIAAVSRTELLAVSCMGRGNGLAVASYTTAGFGYVILGSNLDSLCSNVVIDELNSLYVYLRGKDSPVDLDSPNAGLS